MTGDWTKTCISEVAAVQSGSGFPDRYQGQVGLDIPFYKVSDMNIAGNEREMFNENNSITEEARRELGAFLFPKGSTIFPKIGGAIATNKKRLTTRPCCVDNNVMGIVPRTERIDSQFLYYYFLKHDLSEFANEAHLPSIKKTVVESWPIALPASLREQRRIVAILDEAFEGIATAKANAEKNLQNAQQLLKRYLAMVFAAPDSRWETRALGDAVRFIDYRGKTPPKRDEGIRLITAKNVKMGFIQRDPQEFIDPSVYDGWMTRGFPKLGDVLFTTEAPLGNVAQLDTEEIVVIGQRLITMQPSDEALDRTFLKYALMSPPIQAAIHAKGTGATVLGIKASLLKTIQIWYPRDIDQQEAIVARIADVESEAIRLAELNARKLAALDELKKSFLHQAFTGALTAKSTDKQLEAVA